MSDKQQPSDNWKWAYGAGAVGGLIFFGIAILIASEFGPKLLTWQYYLGTTPKHFEVFTWALAFIGGAVSLAVITWRTILYNNQIEQQRVDALERQFRHAIELLTSGHEKQLAGAAGLQELARVEPQRFAMRSIMALIARLQHVDTLAVRDEQAKRQRERLRSVRFETALTLGRIRFHHQHLVNQDAIRQEVRNHPPIVVTVETGFYENVDLSWLSFIFDAGYISFDESILSGTGFIGEVRDTIFFTHCQLNMAWIDITGGKVNIFASDATYMRLAGWEGKDLASFKKMSPVWFERSDVTALDRVGQIGASIEYKDAWHTKYEPRVAPAPVFNIDKNGNRFEDTSRHSFDASSGAVDGRNKLGMKMYQRLQISE